MHERTATIALCDDHLEMIADLARFYEISLEELLCSALAAGLDHAEYVMVNAQMQAADELDGATRH